MPTVEYRIEGQTKLYTKTIPNGVASSVIIGEANETYMLRDVSSDHWQRCKADSEGKIELYITVDCGVQCLGC